MGYRMYLGRALKGAELVTQEEGYPALNLEVVEQMHELGKYVEWRSPGAVNLMDGDDEELYIVDKSFLIFLIDQYRQINQKNCQAQLVALEDAAGVVGGKALSDKNTVGELAEMIMGLKSKVHPWGEWSEELIKNNADKKFTVTSSWKYEYSIFNLIHILKIMDWDKYNLVYYGF